ncbi:hypothetical protein ABT168_30610 [Streptomyces sp. NPDC001793]|uniref:hypothetical protein n=1 Tax=Streptomyces sp. NPDC001793 TaxID=3154657 RepID=UPI00331CF724
MSHADARSDGRSDARSDGHAGVRSDGRSVVRLLPWTGSSEQPCYLLTDRTGDGPVSRYADRIEALQLRMSVGLLGHAEPIIDDPSADAGQLRFLSAQLRTALEDTVRVAESRGERLEEYRRAEEADEVDEADEADEVDEADADDRGPDVPGPGETGPDETDRSGTSGEDEIGGGSGGDGTS